MQKTNKPALLVAVNISKWEGRKTDKTANATIASVHGTEKGVVNSRKQLLPDSKELQNVVTLAGQIRSWTNSQTLPWMTDGTRILSAQNYFEFTSQFAIFKSKFEAAVRELILVFPAQVIEAQNKLGNLYRPDDYPAPERIAERFHCEMEISPLPDVADFRIDLSDGEKRKFEEKISATQNKAMAEVWQKLFESVKNASEKLADPTYSVRDSLISNVMEICQLLPKLNFTNDPTLEAERVKVEMATAKMATLDLKKDATERKNAADEMAKIMADMSAIMGGTPK